VRIAVDFEGDMDAAETLVGSEEVEVIRVKDFMRIMASNVDLSIVDQRLEELEAHLTASPIQPGRLGPGMRWLGVP
jgi:hypothetical protein